MVNWKLKAALAPRPRSHGLRWRDSGEAFLWPYRGCPALADQLRPQQHPSTGRRTHHDRLRARLGLSEPAPSPAPDQIADAHRIIRREIAARLGEHAAANTRVLYGGSVKPENIARLMAEPEIDGCPRRRFQPGSP